MPYGVILDSTRNYLLHRAAQAGVEPAGLGLEYQWPDDEDHLSPENLYEFTVIFDWVLDEQFYAATDHPLTIADWIADQCREESARQQTEQWAVIVSRYHPDDDGPVRYHVSGDGGQQPGQPAGQPDPAGRGRPADPQLTPTVPHGHPRPAAQHAVRRPGCRRRTGPGPDHPQPATSG